MKRLALIGLLCLGAAKSSQLMVRTPKAIVRRPLVLPAVVVLPPNTNTYGLPLGWLPDFAAVATVIYYGTNAGPPWMGSTNFGWTNWGVVRLPATNGIYWIAGTSLAADGWETGLSEMLTRTNYASVWLQQSPSLSIPSWEEVPGTRITETLTNDQRFYRGAISNFSNWVQLP